MSDIWSFLLQTLTASGVAAVLLAVKAMLRDKLSPRWQFAVWGVLGLVLAVPAGAGGRYALVNWPLFVEFLRSLLTGEFGVLTRVTAPVPLPRFEGIPRTGAEWVYAVYLAGVVFLLGRYLFSYLRLRLALHRGTLAGEDRAALIRETAERYGLPICPTVEVAGLDSAFICGVLRPVLALPAEEETDEKVILHELLHLKHHDAAWGILICVLRCLHWCNPLLWRCGDLAGNDLESLCDQRALELLEGEDRRDYGRILLSMANERYARAPGTSSMANGGANIRRRIEAIARFKRYPAGMALVSVCAALVLAGPCLVGVRSSAVYTGGRQLYALPGGEPLLSGADACAAMASARTTYCTTYAGAFDAYAKAVLEGSPLYRALCAPLGKQNALAEAFRRSGDREGGMAWLMEEAGLPARPAAQSGYQIYNLAPAGDGYEGTLVVELEWSPELGEWDSTAATRYLALQPLRAEKQGDRWVILPLEDFQVVQGDQRSTGNLALPARIYEAQAGDFTLRQRLQTTCAIDGYEEDGLRLSIFPYRSFRTTPYPGGEFTSCNYSTGLTAIYTGPPEERGEILSIGISAAPMGLGEERPELRYPGTGDGGGGDSNGADWGVKSTFAWAMHGDEIPLGGGGGGFSGENAGFYDFPECYAADFYVNGKKTAELTLLPVEGGAHND